MMAHLFIMTVAPSSFDSESGVEGQQEKIKRAMNNIKIPFKVTRMGYNIPSRADLQFYMIRIKKECIAEFLSKVRCRSLNSEKNDMTLGKVLLSTTYGNGKFWVEESCGRMFQYIEYGFKLMNRLNKFLGYTINIITYIYKLILILSYGLTFKFDKCKTMCASLKRTFSKNYFIPFLPTPPYEIVGGNDCVFTGWHETYCFGMMKDIDRGYGEEL